MLYFLHLGTDTSTLAYFTFTYARMRVCAYGRMRVCAYARMHVCAYALYLLIKRVGTKPIVNYIFGQLASINLPLKLTSNQLCILLFFIFLLSNTFDRLPTVTKIICLNWEYIDIHLVAFIYWLHHRKYVLGGV